MHIARTLPDLAAALAPLRLARGTLALVPTMGALHAGHRALLDRARECGGAVAASIFVNPLQFNNADDLARYPRDEAADLAKLREAGCDLVWLPDASVMYPPGDATLVSVAGPAQGWEDAHRPGHFLGMTTVVTKLFGQLRPDQAIFGEKDWQQLQIVRRMVDDLHLGVCVVAVPTVREPDGVALSSRNRFLTPEHRRIAPALHAALSRLVTSLADGAPVARRIDEATRALGGIGFEVDYLALVDAEALTPLERVTPERAGAARLIAAARLGSVRLLDNLPLGG